MGLFWLTGSNIEKNLPWLAENKMNVFMTPSEDITCNRSLACSTDIQILKLGSCLFRATIEALGSHMEGDPPQYLHHLS